ncbi:MAG: hypothetical protein NTY12_04280 [Candidatus Falkowbacteria bacterium]|nr:hypothetical protein [Candidatus Falkowbacteria bacterium]
MKKIPKGSLDKLKQAIGEKVFVVNLQLGVIRSSEYGMLESVNEGVNIVLVGDSSIFLACCLPLGNGRDKILKVYDEQGYIIYDNE